MNKVANLATRSRRPRSPSQILDQLSTAVVILDRELSVSLMNTAAQNLFNCSFSQATGKKLEQLAIYPEEIKQNLKLSIENEQPFTAREIDLKIPDSQTELVDMTANLGNLPNTLVLEIKPVGRFSNIAQEKTDFDRNQTNQILIRGMAHEIKNPLGGIRGAAQLMQKALPSDTDLVDHTEIIISEVDRLRNLVDRMLGPSKALRIEDVNITEVCEKTISLLNSEFDSRLCWERDYDPSLPEIHGDQDQLIQAILNIARNACEALINVDSPRIKFKSRFVGQFTIGDVRHRGVLRVEISDNGPGIMKRDLQRIFYPMVTTKPSGSGIGLAVAQSIISQHKGSLNVKSEFGATTFSINLPLLMAREKSSREGSR